MKKEIITRAGTSIELCEYLDDFYLISEMANVRIYVKELLTLKTDQMNY